MTTEDAHCSRRTWPSFPRQTPSWLLRHPVLLAEWIAAINALRRLRTHATGAVLAGIALTGLVVATFATAADRIADLFEMLLSYRVLLVALVAIYVALAVSRRRERARAHHMRFWLAAAPIDPQSWRANRLVSSFGVLVAQWLTASILIVLSGLAGAVRPEAIVQLMMYVTLAAAAGAAVGWWLGRPREAGVYEESRYVGRPARGGAIKPASDALSTWPIAQVRAWSRPENSRLFVLVALLAVQGGSSAIHGLSVMGLWLLAGYLSALLQALPATARAAANWLRSTPISFLQFAWALMRRVLLHQLVGTVVAAGVMVLLGATMATALYLSALWLSLVVLVGSIAAAESYRGRNPTLRIALGVMTMAAIEARAHLWSIPLAAITVAWHVRKGART
jgi:hypothetical protein